MAGATSPSAESYGGSRRSAMRRWRSATASIASQARVQARGSFSGVADRQRLASGGTGNTFMGGGGRPAFAFGGGNAA